MVDRVKRRRFRAGCSSAGLALSCAFGASPLDAKTPPPAAGSDPARGVWVTAGAREPIGSELDEWERQAEPPSSKSRVHDGVFLRFGWGAAALRSAQLREGPPPDRPTTLPTRRYGGFGSTGSFAFGATPFETIVLATEVSVHVVNQLRLEQGALDPFGECEECDYGMKHISLGGLALIYPMRDFGLNGGLSAGYAVAEQQTLTYRGFVLAPQLGFEQFIGDDWSAGLVVRLTLSSMSGKLEPTGRDSAQIELLSVSGVLTMH